MIYFFCFQIPRTKGRSTPEVHFDCVLMWSSICLARRFSLLVYLLLSLQSSPPGGPLSSHLLLLSP